MTRNRIDESRYRRIAEELKLPESEVKRAVHSFFGAIIRESRTLPFDNEQRIFTKDKFNEYVKVWNVPFIGRIGPVYSRYLKWRGNESKNTQQAKRSDYRSRLTRDDIEHIAEVILSGGTPNPIVKRKKNELYKSVWIVEQGRKKLARQVIPKEKQDVQD